MNQLTGTGVAIVTPFKNHQVDFDALGKLIDYLINGGVQYIVTMGTTGETPVLSKEEKIEVINFTSSYISGRVPLVIGMGGNDTNNLIRALGSYPVEKAVAILSASPYYNKPSQEGIYQHYKAVAAHSPKPLILYNVPGRTGRNITAATTLKLANDIENIIGIKEASGDIIQAMEILRSRPEGFLVLSGDDSLALPQMACGFDGVISVAGNAFPQAFSKMIHLCQQQNFKEAKLLNDKLIPAYNLMFEENNPAGVKAFLNQLGLISNELRLPLVPLSDGLFDQVKIFMTNFKMI
jgi:4-hydroxy-tetrahydrodipicolinate synthase